jgi:hypothetical protein
METMSPLYSRRTRMTEPFPTPGKLTHLTFHLIVEFR